MNGKPVYEVPAKSVINWDSGFKHKLLCDGPTFSTGSACAYSCSFCYVPAMMLKSPHTKDIVEPFEKVVIRRNGALAAMGNQLRSSKGRALADKPLVIYASPLVDVAANMTLVNETIEACQDILGCTEWHIRLLSKSTLLPKIAQGLSGNCGEEVARARMIFGVSTGTLDDKLAKAFEQGTPLVSKRIESLRWLQDNGWRTFGMVCPSLPMFDSQYERFSRNMMEAIRGSRCEHVWAEVINVRGESMHRTYHALHNAGFVSEANMLCEVSDSKEAWEEYARKTFEAHTTCIPKEKLRFLQYVNKDNKPYWEANAYRGAVLL